MTAREKLISEIDDNNEKITELVKRLKELYKLDKQLHVKLLETEANEK